MRREEMKIRNSEERNYTKEEGRSEQAQEQQRFFREKGL